MTSEQAYAHLKKVRAIMRRYGMAPRGGEFLAVEHGDWVTIARVK